MSRRALPPAATHYRRDAALVTAVEVRHAAEKDAEVEAAPVWRRRQRRAELEARWRADEAAAAEEARRAVAAVREAAQAFEAALGELAALGRGELLGKVEAEQLRVRTVLDSLDQADQSVGRGDFGAAGAAVRQARRTLTNLGGPLVVTVNALLGSAAIGRADRERLEENMTGRTAAQETLNRLGSAPTLESLPTEIALHALDAAGLRLAAGILAGQTSRRRTPSGQRAGELAARVVPPQECETFADVGGLEDVKTALRESIGEILTRPDLAARYHVVHNGVLFHGPPGTGKTLLSRAIAGEYGLRYVRFSPAAIASIYVHEAAANLRRMFELARVSAPCLLFLDEIDSIASVRSDQPSADHREIVTQLMTCLEEYRDVTGLVVVAATNDIDHLDPGLREGRFDSKILVPLPDPAARADILRVLLEHREDAVDWDDVDVDVLAAKTSGRNGAALESFVSRAAQRALREERRIGQADLLAALGEREGRDRTSLDQKLTWDDVVLVDDAREQLLDIVNVFLHPDLAETVGVTAPAGVLLHGPPGTGKTTVAKVLANELSASFYAMSAADLLSKWAAESEQKIARLFERARANRPTIVFVDEIDGLLRRRGGGAAMPWEERVVSQFLLELDGLRGNTGVLLVGATNRLDVVDPAIVNRRLTPIEIGLPDLDARARLLGLLCRSASLADDVDLTLLAAAMDGMSGADVKQIRDAAGMRALRRAARSKAAAAISRADFDAALASFAASTTAAGGDRPSRSRPMSRKRGR